ncbi:Ubiquinol-cytochrome-c reductase complex assembly factor 3 [Apodemus speciosus]|uniref:Ubiquinol-cytochrome-c reductase complex assembly factor 3 n=1 Tax=Apodemus speciosus TaxID=105296 RepID=A0ABQ0FSE8_APOSI
MEAARKALSMLQEMPERDSRRRDEAVKTQELVMATLKDAAATKENVAWRRNWAVSGDGRTA